MQQLAELSSHIATSMPAAKPGTPIEQDTPMYGVPSAWAWAPMVPSVPSLAAPPIPSPMVPRIPFDTALLPSVPSLPALPSLLPEPAVQPFNFLDFEPQPLLTRASSSAIPPTVLQAGGMGYTPNTMAQPTSGKVYPKPYPLTVPGDCDPGHGLNWSLVASQWDLTEGSATCLIEGWA